jgi:hypothetical protein
MLETVLQIIAAIILTPLWMAWIVRNGRQRDWDGLVSTCGPETAVRIRHSQRTGRWGTELTKDDYATIAQQVASGDYANP